MLIIIYVSSLLILLPQLLFIHHNRQNITHCILQHLFWFQEQQGHLLLSQCIHGDGNLQFKSEQYLVTRQCSHN